MNRQDLIAYKEKLAKLSEKDYQLRELMLKDMADGTIQGPVVEYPEISKTWYRYYNKKDIINNIPEKKVNDVIFDNNANYMNDTALEYFGRKITYNELKENGDKAARSFTKLGVKEGDHVSLIMPSLPETTYALFGLLKIGAVATLIDPRYNPEKIKSLINETKSDIVMTVNIAEDKIEQVKDDLQCSKIFSVSPAESLPLGLKLALGTKEKIEKIRKKKANNETWKEFIEYGQDPSINVIESEYKKDAPAAIVFTGGTTGNSKGAIMTTHDLNTLMYCQDSALRLVERHSKYLGVMPPFIAFGLAVGLLNPLSVGAVVDLIPTFDPHKFGKLIVQHKPNHVIVVPSVWEEMANSKYAKNKNFSYLKTIVAGGDGMTIPAEEEFNNFIKTHGCPDTKITKGYGMTEVTSCATYTVEDAVNKPGSVGIPLVKDMIKIVDHDTGEELPYGCEGEVYIYSPALMGGYLNNPEETKKLIFEDVDGKKWVKSGDIGHMDKDGCLYIVDRIKHMIIRPDGFKVYPTTIENYIKQVENVSMCKVVGGKDPEYVKGEFPVAYIVVDQENVDETIENVKKTCREHLPEYQLPIDYIPINEIPLTLIGKADVKVLQKKYNEMRKSS